LKSCAELLFVHHNGIQVGLCLGNACKKAACSSKQQPAIAKAMHKK
jgi:hypothetical protein